MKLGIIGLLFLSCTGFGFLKTMDLYDKLRQIRFYQEFLHGIRSEILFVQTPLVDSVVQASMNGDERIQKFANSLKQKALIRSWDRFSQFWEECCDETIQDFQLQEVWKRLGRQLGRGGLEQQEQALNHCEIELNRLEKNALDLVRVKGKMYVSMGACCGVFLSVLLI